MAIIVVVNEDEYDWALEANDAVPCNDELIADAVNDPVMFILNHT